MSETVNKSKHLIAEAWAVASMAPARSGTRGYSASAWAITYDCWATEFIRHVVASHAPNRDEWLAGIMAIRGVLENIDPSTLLTIYVPNKELAGCYLSGWVSARGLPQAQADAAAPIFQLRDALRINLRIVHRSLDARGESLKMLARHRAQEKDKTLTSEDRKKIPRRRDEKALTNKNGFPPVDDEQ